MDNEIDTPLYQNLCLVDCITTHIFYEVVFVDWGHMFHLAQVHVWLSARWFSKIVSFVRISTDPSHPHLSGKNVTRKSRRIYSSAFCHSKLDNNVFHINLWLVLPNEIGDPFWQLKNIVHVYITKNSVKLLTENFN